MPDMDALRAALDAFEQISADPDNDSNDAVEDAGHALAAEVRELLTSVTVSEDPRPNGLLPEDGANFDTLMRAATNDDVFLYAFREKATGHGHALICIKSTVGGHEGEDELDVIPVARMLDDDAVETYENPEEG